MALQRITIFAKGNLDVRDSLHGLKMDDAVLWNGINVIVRERFPGTLVRVRHETFARSDLLLRGAAGTPPELLRRALPLGAYPLASQFGQAVFQTRDDAIVLSIQPDLLTRLARHKRDDYLFYPYNWEAWSAGDRDWLRREFDPTGLLDVDASMRNLESIVRCIRQTSSAPILVYNFSSVVPGDSIHAYQASSETLATRIRKFNLGLIRLSELCGISVVDADRVIARAGADRLKLDALHLNADGCRLVAEEVVRILDELGLFSGQGMSE